MSLQSKNSKLILGLTSLLFALAVYLYGYPNDFFLSLKPFHRDSEYLVEKNFFKLKVERLDDVNRDLHDLLDNPDAYLQNPKSWLKNNKKRTVALVKVGENSYFIKRYNISSLFDYITKCPFRSSKAFRSLYYAKKFEDQGIKTPKPIALLENRFGIFWTKTYLVFAPINGQTLERAIEEDSLDLIDQKRISHKLTESLKILSHNKWVHRDLTARNIFLVNREIYFLDLDDVHSYAFRNLSFKTKFKRKHLQHLPSDLKNSKIRFQIPHI